MKTTITFALSCLFLISGLVASAAAGSEFTGQFEPTLFANKEDDDQLVLKHVTRDRLKGAFEVPQDAHLAAARLVDPRTGNASVIMLLVEEPGEDPIAFIDLNGDGQLASDEKIALKKAEDDNPYLWEATGELKNNEGLFKTCPVFVRYFKRVKMEGMSAEDRLITQTTQVMARGKVDVKGRPVIFQYEIDAKKQKVNPQMGWLGVDTDGNGVVDMGAMSPESAKAREESVVFRIGDTYVSTKKADVSKNQITVVEREAKEYKRLEIYINKPFPEFSFTDFDGKKRNFSEYRGKYVLLDIWGFWCPPCRRELPYIREAQRRFGARNFVVLGLNTDEDFTIDSMRKGLKEANMTWTNAQFESVAAFLRDSLRVNSFPTTFLIDPNGNVLSISRTDRGELDLRGRDLLESLDKTIPMF
jgi:thiol-disulfide isomerase/thioredoxin